MDFDDVHKKHINLYLNNIERMFYDLIDTLAVLVIRVQNKGFFFAFDKYPKIKKQSNKEFFKFYKNLDRLIKKSIETEWNFANKKNDFVWLDKNNLPRNLQALAVFKERKIKNFTISDRIWNITKSTKKELELAIEVSLSEGKSANELSREIRHLLKNPDRLFRKVKDKHGNLVLSKKAQELHTGRGVYRSSYKNAMRLASNEINVAYKTADLLRIQQNPDIVGFEVALSKQHKVYDVCDELKGKYPKDFQFYGWHVQCKCHIKPILKSEAELFAELNNDLELPAESSKNYVSDVPENFKKWTNANKSRVEGWKTQPDWWSGNKKYLPFGISDKTERYKDIPFKELHIKGNGTLEVFTKGKQGKQEFKPNLQTLNILAEKGYKYKLLPVIDDGNKNPDAFNLLTQKFADIKNASGTNGKNIIQSAIKEAKAQNVEELIIRLVNNPTSYRDMYIGFKTALSHRNLEMKTIILILPDNTIKTYDLQKIIKKIKASK